MSIIRQFRQTFNLEVALTRFFWVLAATMVFLAIACTIAPQAMSGTYEIAKTIELTSSAYWCICLLHAVGILAYRIYKFGGFVSIQKYPDYHGVIWTPEQLLEQAEYFKDFPRDKEIIVAAANRGLDGRVWAVVNPGRHFHCIAMMDEHEQSEPFVKCNTVDQGFMTNTNRYISRKEAAALAVKNGQVKEEDLRYPDTIFSEDLWSTPDHLKYKQPNDSRS